MRAVVFKDSRISFVSDMDLPEIPHGHALIKAQMCGICKTDLEITRGYAGYSGVLGHEFIGTVEHVEGHPVHHLLERRVVGSINLGCCVCEYCRHGMSNHCPKRAVLGIVSHDGAMADYLTLPVDNLYPVPDNVSDEEAVFSEPIAAALRIQEQIKIKPDSRVLVMGDGRLGLLCAMTLKHTQCDLYLSGRHEHKLDIAKNAGIKTIQIDHSTPDERGYDVVVEATGSTEGLKKAAAYVKPCGTIALKSTTAWGSALDQSITNLIVVNEINIIGSRCGPFAPALRSLESKMLDVRPLITASYPIEDALAAFEHAMKRDAIKILIDLRG